MEEKDVVAMARTGTCMILFEQVFCVFTQNYQSYMYSVIIHVNILLFCLSLFCQALVKLLPS